ncbi:VIR protein [Plasmodium vivax]|uniref:VIR protein n=1 Tax=Plasmodium vivax TaxID=5855 RepID=A0A1G4E392_PLAVI|nr:VIR protein [Plasmodium vivax]
MAYWAQYNRRVTDMFRKLQGAGCTSNYIDTKNEIEQKINTFNYNDPKNFCNRCNVIKKSIYEKTKGLQQCYNSSQLHPIESIVNIKEFIDKCPDLPNCSYPPNNPVRKPVASKVQKTYSCPGSRNCEGKTVIPDEQKSKAAPGISARNPQAGRSEEKSSLKEDRGHSDGNELRDGKVISLSRPEAIPPSDPVRTQDKGSESTVNKPSVSTEKTDTSMQYVSSPSPSASIELDTTPSALSSQSSVTRDSHSSSNTKVEDLNKGGPITNLAGVQIEGANQLQNIDVAAQNNQGLADDNTHAIETSVGTVSGSASSKGDKADYEESSSKDANDRLTNDQVGDAVVDQGNTDSRGSQIQVANSGDLVGGDESHRMTTNEGIHHANGSDVHTTRVKASGSELTSGNDNELGIFNQISNVIIKNKENVINTSIPMGIVLLLSLLFKYTPLWTILTKRKRKKQSHMNEKLQRVLQQPSIVSEERSIPFSYSAYEYST